MWSNITILVTSFFTRLQVHREEGQGLVEYALILALVSVAVVGVLTTLGGSIGTELSKVVADI
jgi:pilus assembly protein Flp/PilA